MTQPEGEGTTEQKAGEGGGDELSTKLAAAEAERESLKEALAKANRDAARNRRKASSKTSESSDEPDDEPDSSDDKSTTELKRLRREAAELRKETRETHAMDALADSIEDAGGEKLSRATLRRYVRMLDSLKPDELEDAIEDLREELPHLFEAKKTTRERVRNPRVRTGGGDSDEEDSGQRARNKILSESTKKMLKANGLM